MSTMENVYFVLTEEGMEGTGRKTAREALIEYIDQAPADDEWIDDLINGETEINSIVKMTRQEYKEWLKTAIEVWFMTNTNTPPVEYTSPENVPDGANVNKTPNPVTIDQPNVNENTETVQVELREKPTLLNSIPIELVAPIVEYTALSNIVFMDSHGQEYGQDEDYDNQCDKLYKSELRLAEAITHQLSLKDTEHAKAIELARVEAKIKQTKRLTRHSKKYSEFISLAHSDVKFYEKRKEEIENARN